MKTVITHFYNEEYLLPWWLNHHKKYFDFGILIDYGSTDRSVEICKQICPHWQVLPSGNQYFDAAQCDYEVMFYERQITGWRTVLTTTEFLVGNLDNLCVESQQPIQWLIPEVSFVCWEPDKQLDSNKELWEQISFGIPYTVPALSRRPRSLHNFNDLSYNIGRHYDKHNTESAVIFHYANAIYGQGMLNRRLQIQHKISENDKKQNLGWNHHYANQGLTAQNLELLVRGFYSMGCSDCSDYINKYTK